MRCKWANMWSSDFAIGRSMKSDGQFSYSGFAESLLSEATMTRTGLPPSLGLLNEVRRPHVGQLPSSKPSTELFSEVGRPCVGQILSLALFQCS